MDAQAYHDDLLKQGYLPDDAIQFTEQHYPDFKPRPVPPVGGPPDSSFATIIAPQPMLAGKATRPDAERPIPPTGAGPMKQQGWLGIILMICMISATVFALQSPAWMSGDGSLWSVHLKDEFGLEERRVTEVNNPDDALETWEYDCDSPWESEALKECEQVVYAEHIATFGLWIAIVMGGVTIVLMLLRQINAIHFGIGQYLAYGTGLCSLLAAIGWFVSFPQLENLGLFQTYVVGPGFFTAIGGALFAFFAGATAPAQAPVEPPKAI